MRKLLITNNLTYLVFSEIYLRYTEPKSRRKAFTILEAAIACYDRRGFDSVTYKMIAREVGMTTPALRHYFSDLNEIREYSIKYIHMIAQKLVVDSMANAKNPAEMLKKYLQGHLLWSKNFKRHLCVWISFITFSSRHKKERALNTEAVLNGAYRISDILSQGRLAGDFHHKDDFLTARLMQTIILGWLTTLVTEDIEDPTPYTQAVVNQCFSLAVFKTETAGTK